MFSVGIFRERAVLRNTQPDPLDDLLRVTAPHEWIILAGFAVVFLVICAWSVLGTVERNLTASGVVMRGGERHAVLSGAAGTVTEILVGVNETVAEGQPIARLLLPGIGTRIAVVRARIAGLERDAGDGGAASEPGLRLMTAREELAELTAHRAASAITAPHDGVISALHLHVGQAVAAGAPVAELRSGAADGLEVVTFLPATKVGALEVGMQARVLTTRASGVQSVPAEVAEVAPDPSPPPAWFSRTVSGPAGSAGGPVHRVRLVLQHPPGTPPVDIAPCRIDIILEQVSPAGLLLAGAGSATG